MSTSTAEEYLQGRLAEQVAYHNHKATTNKRSYRRLVIFSVAATSLTPLLLVLEMIYSPPPHDDPVQLTVEILPVVAAVIGAVATLLLAAFRHKDTWAHHRLTCESLQREAQLFRFGAGPYASDEDPSSLLVERCEALMSTENASWKSLQGESPTPTDGMSA